MEPSVVVKVFAILEAMSNSPEGRSLASLAEAVALPKPTLHRLLKIMVGLGYVDRAPDAAYRLTSKFRHLASEASHDKLVALAQPLLNDLHQQTTETINLGVLRGDRVIYLHVMESRHPLRRIAEPDSADPFHCTALGRAIVANLDANQRDYLLNEPHGFAKRTPYTAVEEASLRAILEKVRRDGYALERDQTDVGVTCIAAPIWEEGSVIAAISISAPTARVGGAREKELVNAVCDAASAITEQLDHQLEEVTSA